jgi:hypothetical protein
MQAGAPVGEPLTFKYANVLKVRQDLSWNPEDDSDEMIQAGAWFMETVTGRGRRVVRNVTTHLTSNNLAFVEASVNQVVNQATYELRQTAETLVGRPGTPLIVQSAKGVLANKLNLLLDNKTILQWRSLSLKLDLDILEVSVEIAPVLPINFIPITVHLVAVPLAA